MKLTDLDDGESAFLDANVLVYHFAPHPVFGPATREFIRRIETGAIAGYTSTAVLSETAHHLMSFEASVRFGWTSKVVQHLRSDPTAVQQLDKFWQAIVQVPRLGIRVLTIPESLVETAAAVSKQPGLLTNDALIVGIMRQQGLRHLASNDADFDRVPGITRYAPP